MHCPAVNDDQEHIEVEIVADKTSDVKQAVANLLYADEPLHPQDCSIVRSVYYIAKEKRYWPALVHT
jgi:hypothetical protein